MRALRCHHLKGPDRLRRTWFIKPDTPSPTLREVLQGMPLVVLRSPLYSPARGGVQRLALKAVRQAFLPVRLWELRLVLVRWLFKI